MTDQVSMFTVNIQEASYQETYKPILYDINISIKAERITWLRGANGSGKTTILKILSGVAASSGIQVKCKGALPPDVLFIPSDVEEAFLFIRPIDDLFAFCVDRKINFKEINKMLVERLQAAGFSEEILHRQSTSLSRGERKFLAVVIAVLVAPPVLILDEPFEHLDLTAHNVMISTIDFYLKNGGAILLASHISDKLLDYKSDIVTLRQPNERIKDNTSLEIISRLHPSLCSSESLGFINHPRVASHKNIFRKPYWIKEVSEKKLLPDQLSVIRGGNGAGKTSVLRTLCGARPLYKGTLCCGKATVIKSKERQVLLQQSAHILQSPINFENFNSQYNYNKTVKSVMEDLFGISVTKLKPAQLSSGQRSFQSLLEVSMTDASFCFLDEPFAHLDENLKIAASKLIDKMVATSALIVVAEHKDLLVDSRVDTWQL